MGRTQKLKASPVQNDDLTERFFRNITELAVIHCLNIARMEPMQPNAPSAQPQPVLNYVAVDALVKLAVCLVTGILPPDTFIIRKCLMLSPTTAHLWVHFPAAAPPLLNHTCLHMLTMPCAYNLPLQLRSPNQGNAGTSCL